MVQVNRCTSCERFQNSMGRWFEVEMETLTGIVTDPNIEIVHVICPDCVKTVQNNNSADTQKGVGL